VLYLLALELKDVEEVPYMFSSSILRTIGGSVSLGKALRETGSQERFQDKKRARAREQIKPNHSQSLDLASLEALREIASQQVGKPDRVL
jgi:hypothetical protein